MPSLNGLGPMTLARRFSRHRYLLKQIILKNLTTQYRGSFGGLAWMVLRPLLTLGIFGFCFGVVYHSRFFPSRPGAIEFAMALFVGLTIFTVAADMIGRRPR